MSIWKNRAGCETAPEDIVSRGQTLGYLGQTNRLAGYVAVHETDIELIQIGQPVNLYVPHSPTSISGTVTNISLEAHRQSDAGTLGRVEAEIDKLPGFYMVEFEFDPDPRILVGSEHKVVIIGNTTTLAKCIRRWWQNSRW